MPFNIENTFGREATLSCTKLHSVMAHQCNHFFSVMNMSYIVPNISICHSLQTKKRIQYSWLLFKKKANEDTKDAVLSQILLESRTNRAL
jgi:hypothetical protein